MSVSAVAYVALLCLSGAITGGLAVYAWRRRDEPGARPFVGFTVTVTVWSVCAAVTMLARDPTLHSLAERVIWIALAFVPVFWIWFATAYTGTDELVSARNLVLLSILPLISSVLGLLPPFQHLVWTLDRVYVFDGIATATIDAGILYWITVIYGYTLILIGMILLVRLVFVSDYLFADQAALLVVGLVVALVGSGLTLFGIVPVPGFSFTPYAFAATGVAFGYALFRRRLFELVPATRRLGRDTAIATLDDGILILDNDYQVIYLNPEAADVLDCDPKEALGTLATDLLDTDAIDFDVPDALAELHIDGRFYEARTSTITDRRDREIGYTVVLRDITGRKRRERRLRRQRDELERLDRLNEVIREATHAFVSATTRDAIEEAVCEHLDASDLYTEARIVIDHGETSIGDEPADDTTPTAVSLTGTDEESNPVDSDALPDGVDAERGSWAVVPLGYGRSVYGVLVLRTTRTDGFDARELAVLDRFGDTTGQAITAVENQRLLRADTVTELTFRCPDAALAAVAETAACRLSLRGFVPATDEALVYCDIEDGSLTHIVDAASEIEGIGGARVVDGTNGVVEFTLRGRSALLALSGGGTNVRTAETAEAALRVVVEVAPGKNVRALTERVREHCPRATLAAKRALDRPIATEKRDVPDTLAELTDRQRDVLEAAYRAGYFRWPRDRTAEEVAESIDISSPTLHKHLRKGEERLLSVVFDAGNGIDRERGRK